MITVQIRKKNDIYLPEPLESIDEDSFWKYYIWQDDSKELSREIAGKFGETAKASSPFDEDNPVPRKEPLNTPFKCGSVEFEIVNKNTTKRPDYAKIFEDFDRYLLNFEDSWKRGALKKGYRTYESELYVLAEDLCSWLEEKIDKTKEEKAGVEKRVNLVSPVRLAIDIPNTITIVYGTDYSAPSEYNARIYQQARNILEEGSKRTVGEGKEPNRIHRFKELLLKDSFQRLVEKPEKTVRLSYPFEHIVFCHLIRPEITGPYSSVVPLFIKPFPEGVEEGKKTLRKGTNVGDLVLARSLAREGFPGLLREKGILTEEFEETYDPRPEEGNVYIRLSEVRNRIKKYIEDIKHITYNQQVLIERPR